MIFNSKINLSPDSQIRQEALNTIRYTLFLNYQTPRSETNEISITNLMNQCQQCCLGLFQKSTYNIHFNFFGNNNNMDKNIHSRLKDLEWFSFNPAHSEENNIGFPIMILHHCILSSYHAVLTALIGNESVTSYQIVNKIKTKGAHSLYSKRQLPFQSNYLNRDLYISGISANKRSSKASDFNRKEKNHTDETSLLFNTTSLFQFKDAQNADEKESLKYRLQFAGLYSRINDISAPKWRYKKDKILTIDKLELLINELGNTLFFKQTYKPPEKDSPIPKEYYDIDPDRDPIDGLYHSHIIERSFNFNLIYCLLNNLECINGKEDFSLSKKDITNIFTASKNLPNTINRQYFIQYAFNQIFYTPDSDADFWNEHALNFQPKNTPRNPLHSTYPSFKRDKWVTQFSLFCNYWGLFIIPIYEWCFINLLMESIEIKYKEKTHDEHLKKALDLLSNYIEQHIQDFFIPIIPRIKKDTEKNKQKQTEYEPDDKKLIEIQNWLDLVSEHEKQIKDIITPEALSIISDVFFNKDDIDLNLKHINPSLFLKGRENMFDSNEERIHNFYINLMKDSLYTNLMKDSL